MKRIKIDGMKFVNENGDQVLMNGINLVCKEREKGYIEPNVDELLRIYSKRGFNLVRLGIFWDGVEPEPGIYDEVYLDKVSKVVEVAEQYGIYIMLDMHQDLFSVKYGDGAPQWATLDEGLPHPENCRIWYEAYLTSQAIMKAADNFWSNKAAVDGVGLLDHYEAMWEYIAAKFNKHSNIIGFEPMNEPYMGSLAPKAFGMAFSMIKDINPNFEMNNPSAMTEQEREIMENTMVKEFVKFDKEILMPFYNRILKAIRKVSDLPLITGGNVYSSAFVATGIENLTDSKGNTDTQQIYAPHGYDFVVDTDNYEAFNKENVYSVFAQKRASQLNMQIPAIVGEWGAFPSKAFTNQLIEHMSGILEEYLWSSTYWVYREGMENDENYSSLERGYPVCIGGNLMSYHYDYEVRSLSVSWEGKKGRNTILYFPDLTTVDEDSISVSKKAQIDIHKFDDVSGGYVIITPDEDGVADASIK